MHLTAAEWARIEQLFPLVAELAAVERARFLDRECAGEPRVRSELEAMLAAAVTEDRLLDRPIGLTSTEAPQAAAESLAAGTRLGSWKIRAPIGTGGMGEVYLAERADGAYTMNAAIKLLKRELFSFDNAQRFLRERRVLARLTHPNIARVLDAGTTDDGRPYLVMEYVHGARITDHARTRNLSPNDAARLMLAVAEAVAEAHRRGVVHRDLKPANVMVNDEQQVKLLDFGIARLMDEEDTQSRVLPMTPAYAAPEQLRGETLTPAADVYALGVMLFQLLTLRLPHSREGMPLPVIVSGLRNETVARPSRAVLDSEGLFPDSQRGRRARQIAGDLDWITLKALRPDPRRRYANAGEFAEDLRRHLEHKPVVAREESLTRRARQFFERHAPARRVTPADAHHGDYKYWAFISYSHQDETWARWLHTTLETYRVPRRLVGRPLGDETVPRRLFPVFRDRDELASSHELGAVINLALRQSRNLIVVCSPRSATSRWVNEEIRTFRAMGRGSRIFCLIVDGEPHASAKPEIAFSECFAPALRDKGIEPIAADARPRKDGKAGSKLKLLAGILDVGLDELKQREKQRALRQRLLTAVASLAIVGALAGSWQWFATQREAREQEILVEKLVENGRTELLGGRNARAAVYLNEALKLGHDTVPLRYMLGQAMQPIDALTNVRFHHGGTVLRAAFSPDGKQVAMAVRIKDEVVGKIFDATTGAEVGQLKSLPMHPRIFQFFPDGKRLFVSGFQKLDYVNGYIEEQPVTGIWGLEQPAPALSMEGNVGRIGTPIHPDGVRFVIPGKSGGVEIWDSLRATKLKTLAAGRTIAACGFSANGKQLLLADDSGNVELWSSEPARRLSSLSGAEGLYVVGLLFFPDGKQALAVTGSGDVRIWDLTQSKLRLAYLADPQSIRDAQLNRDGRRLLTLGRDGYKVWSTSRGLLAFSINKQLRTLATAALSASGNYLFTADGESPVAEAWGVLSKALLYSLDLHAENLTFVALDRDDRRLLTASSDGYAEIWSSKIRPRWDLEVLEGDPLRVRFIASGADLMVGGGTADSAYLQRVSTEAAPVSFSGHRAAVIDVAVSPDGNHVLTASEDGTSRWWGTKGGPATALFGHTSGLPLHRARLSPDGRRAVTADGWPPPQDPDSSHAPQCLLWEPASGRKIALLAHDKAVYTADFNHAGTMLATGGTDGVIKLWRPSDGQLLQVLEGHTDVVASLNFSADDLRLVSASDDKSVRIWNAATGQPLNLFNPPGLGTPTDAIFARNAGLVAIATLEGVIWLWSPRTATANALKGHVSAVRWLRFLHEDRLLLSAGYDGSVRAWDPDRLRELGRAAVNRFEIQSFDVNADQSLLATASLERLLGLWDIALERRSASDIEARLRCRAPWMRSGLELSPRIVDPAGCPQ